MMLETPAFKPHLRIVPVPGEGVLALTEGAASLRRGPHLARICSLIDGRRRADEIVEAVLEEVNPAQAWSVLMQLEASGWIEESAAASDRNSRAFWLALGVDPQQAEESLGTGEVRIIATSTGIAERFDAALRRFGIRSSSSHSIEAPPAMESANAPPGLDVVLVNDYLSDALSDYARLARAGGRRWLLLRPVGTSLWIGPFFSPGETPCPDCLRIRLSRHRPSHVFASFHDPDGGTAEPLGSLAGTEDVACLMAAMEVAKVLIGGPSALSGVVKTLDLSDLSSRKHEIVPYPACRVCGTAPADAPGSIEVRPAPIRFTEGGYRSVRPEETVRVHSRLLSPICGVVGELIPHTHTSAIGYMYIATDAWPLMEGAARMDDLSYRFRQSSVGKGRSEAQAKASALCEAVERYSTMRHGTEITSLHSYNEIREDAIHPNAVMGFSERQLEMSNQVGAERSDKFKRVPAPLDPDKAIEWTPVWSLTEGRHRFLPTELLYFCPPRKRSIAFGDSNGCAAGNSLDEAILQGFLELAERDAVSVWWYNRLALPAVDLGSFADDWLLDLAGHYRALGRELALIDLTNDLGVPVVAAISHRTSGEQERIALGLGCHLDPAIAVERAVTEVVQMLDVDLIRGDEAVREFAGGWMEWGKRAEQAYLVPDRTVHPRCLEDFQRPRFDDLRACVEHCRNAVESRGMEMLVLDLTRQDTRMPVARVIVPGLRHFWPRFAPGRLFDVPLTLGLRTAATPESELNSIPFVF